MQNHIQTEVRWQICLTNTRVKFIPVRTYGPRRRYFLQVKPVESPLCFCGTFLFVVVCNKNERVCYCLHPWQSGEWKTYQLQHPTVAACAFAMTITGNHVLSVANETRCVCGPCVLSHVCSNTSKAWLDRVYLYNLNNRIKSTSFLHQL